MLEPCGCIPVDTISRRCGKAQAGCATHCQSWLSRLPSEFVPTRPAAWLSRSWGRARRISCLPPNRSRRARNGGSGSRTQGGGPVILCANGASIPRFTRRSRRVLIASRPSVRSTMRACGAATSSRPKRACSSIRDDQTSRVPKGTSCRSSRSKGASWRSEQLLVSAQCSVECGIGDPCRLQEQRFPLRQCLDIGRNERCLEPRPLSER